MSKELSDKYVKLSGVEHVLQRPDTYIGTVGMETKSLFVATNFEEDIKKIKMEYREVTYSPGFVKIFDEALTNASDHAIRTGEVSYIKVNIIDDIISIENDGPGVPVVMHAKEKIFIPEMVFGNLLSGENFDDSKERFLGGRNGIGIKCTNIFSKEFVLETADGKKSYIQTFKNNMSIKTKPVTRKSKKSFTKVSYKTDFDRFSMENIDEVTMSILVKRVFDIAAYNPKLKVSLNGTVIPIRNFKDYMKLFLKEGAEIFYEQINEEWEIGITESPVETFTQVSMVNGISTTLGGTHVNYASKMVTDSVKTQLSRGNKVNIRIGDIKNRILLFVNCKLPNPTFNSQTKEDLTLRLNSLSKNVIFNPGLLKKIAKAPMFADLLELSLMKEKLDALKELNKIKTSRMRIDKLVDANKAGKVGHSGKSNLLITEGECLHEDEKIVIIRDGNKLNIPIKDVTINDLVITHNNNIKPISNISKKIERIVKIKLGNGLVLKCSENHRWQVYDIIDDKFKFIQTKEINNKRHKFIKNKNYNFKSFININYIENINEPQDKYNYILTTDVGEISSTPNHLFSVFNKRDGSFDMVEAQNIDIKTHLLVEYYDI